MTRGTHKVILARYLTKNLKFNAMSEAHYFRFTNRVLLVPLLLVLLIWTVFLIEVRFGINLNVYGVYPRSFQGMQGIFFSPFIHGSIEHLFNNTLPLAILSAALVYFYRAVSLRVLLWGFFMTGAITWCIGRPSYHIGASGIIYLLASFIFFKGILTRHYRLVALSLVVVFIYGGLLWYIFPVKDGISWEGHLAGFISGLILALTLKAEVPAVKKFAWEAEDYNEAEDEFLRHFDEDGNFIEREKEPPPETGEEIKITYHFKKSPPNKEEMP
jgi:membrane associated rhomboid family serine protease